MTEWFMSRIHIRSPDPVRTLQTSQVSWLWITGYSQSKKLNMVKLLLASMMLKSGTNYHKSEDLRQC